MENINRNKKLVSDFFIEGYQNHNYDLVMNMLSVDYYDNSPASARSNQDAVGILKIVEQAYSDMRIKILDIFGENDRIAVRVEYSATRVDDNKSLLFEALEIFRVSDNKIVESWGYWPEIN